MASAPVVLILGAGANVGAHVARAFAAKGYKIALASRSAEKDHDEDGYVRVQADFADPSSTARTFATVRQAIGHPSVVVYNGAPPPHRCFQRAETSLSADEQVP